MIDRSLNCWHVTKERVANILRAKGLYDVAFVRELISSVWDVDKMDYLLRDSMYCGVRYGSYDLERIIDTITLYDQEEDGVLKLGIEYGGIHAIEGFILARYFMFTQVYFHTVRRAYDLLLTDFIAELLRDTLGTDCYPQDLTEYIKWNDWKVLAQMSERMDKQTQNLAWRLASRRHPKPIYETADHADRIVVGSAITKLPLALSAKYPDVKFWYDKAIDHPERFKMGDEAWPVKRTNGRWESLTSLSRALAGLEEIRRFRVYTDVDDDTRTQMETFCRGVIG